MNLRNFQYGLRRKVRTNGNLGSLEILAIKNLKKFNICKFLFMKQYFSIPNINLKWFQLSFDVYIVYIGQKLQIFKNLHTESWKFLALKWGYFGATLWKYSESKNDFQRFYRRMNMPNVIRDHFWWILVKNGGVRPH